MFSPGLQKCVVRSHLQPGLVTVGCFLFQWGIPLGKVERVIQKLLVTSQELALVGFGEIQDNMWLFKIIFKREIDCSLSWDNPVIDFAMSLCYLRLILKDNDILNPISKERITLGKRQRSVLILWSLQITKSSLSPHSELQLNGPLWAFLFGFWGVWFVTSLSRSHTVDSVHLLPLSAFLELGQFARVEDLIFFLKVSLSIAVVFPGEEKKQSIFSHSGTCLSHSLCFSKVIIFQHILNVERDLSNFYFNIWCGSAVNSTTNTRSRK